MTPCLSLHSYCSELVVKGLAAVVFAKDGFQFAVSYVRFLKANGHCFRASSTEVSHELLCSNPFVSLILPLSYHLGVVAHSQLKKKGAHCIGGKNSSHRLYIFQCPVSCMHKMINLPNCYKTLPLYDSPGKHFLNIFSSPNCFCS